MLTFIITIKLLVILGVTLILVDRVYRMYTKDNEYTTLELLSPLLIAILLTLGLPILSAGFLLMLCEQRTLCVALNDLLISREELTKWEDTYIETTRQKVRKFFKLDHT